MIFTKSSTRTRVSFETGMYQLGGQALFLSSADIQLGRGEPIRDTARVLSRYVDGIMIRTFKQSDVEELAEYGTVPVINGLTDYAHPCQVLADLMTVREIKGSLKNLKLCFIGDGNNMANSLIAGAVKVGMQITVCCPKGYEPDAALVQWGTESGLLTVTDDVPGGAADADVIYTDVWASMGQESEAEVRAKAFRGFQVNAEVMAAAKPDAMVLHCLPAHRGDGDHRRGARSARLGDFRGSGKPPARAESRAGDDDGQILMEKVYLVLQSGSVYEGFLLGADTETEGEIVFTTAMTGYMETLTDPSYYGQIVVQTFPMIGNYGAIGEDAESGGVFARGYVVRELCESPSNYRSSGTLDAYLKARGIPCVCGVDTRAVTKEIRESGVMNAKIVKDLSHFPDFASYRVENAVKNAGGKARVVGGGDAKYRVAFLDYGAKENIVRCLVKRGAEVSVFPHDAAAE